MSKDKTKKKKGCLPKILIALFILIVIAVGTVYGLQSSKQLFGERIEVIKTYVEALTKPVDESKLITNPVANYSEFDEVAKSCGFAKQNVSTNLDSTMSTSDRIFGAYLSNFLNAKEDLLTIREFSINSENSLRIIFKYNLKDIKNSLKIEAIPDSMYISNDYLFEMLNDGGLNQIKVTLIDSLINQLDKTMSDSILKFFKGIDDQGISKMFKEYENKVFKEMNDIAVQTQTMLSLTYLDNKGTVTYEK